MTKKDNKKPDEVETTGHSWDGIEEFNNPLPRWWLWLFYITIVWGIGYTIAYPAWPLLSRATPGLLEWSTRGEVAADIEAFDTANEGIETRLASAELTEISADADLERFAVSAGGAVFRTWCAQCHGSGASGARGYPNLLDNDWLWGGSIEDIYLTISHGIRTEEDPEARYSQMPAFGEFMESEQIAEVVQHVMAISGQEADSAMAAAGAEVFANECSSCHGDDGTGDRFQGAPNLTDAIWLYAGDVDTLTESVTNARFGVMPNWSSRLSESDIRAVSIFVHSRGGGE